MAKILPVGKGAWLHNYQTPVDTVVAEVKRAGLGHFFVKIVDGTVEYGTSYPKQELIAKLQDDCVQVWGWGYTYGTSPTKEAQLAASLVTKYGVDGFVIDAENEYKGKQAAATSYASALRAALPRTPIGLSTYRYPEVHPTFPFAQFRKYVDFDAPQVYWVLAHNPVNQLFDSMKQYAKLTPVLPYVPTGAAWKQPNWGVTPGDINSFLDAVQANNLSGATFWEYNHAQASGLWETIVAYPWNATPPCPPVDYGPRIEALEAWVLAANTVLKNHDDRIHVLEDAEELEKTNFTVTSRAVARITNKNNDAGKPIMVIKEPRVIFSIGTKLLVDPKPVDADGSINYYKVLSQPGDLYVRAVDGALE